MAWTVNSLLLPPSFVLFYFFDGGGVLFIWTRTPKIESELLEISFRLFYKLEGRKDK